MKLLYKHNFTIRRIRAFTLLEVMSSLVIVTMVILGPLTSAINSASYSRQTKDVMVSTRLAEEALELLRFQYNTLYLECINVTGACNPRDNTMTPGEQAWYLFKNRLAGSSASTVDPTNASGKSCFDLDGCSYDFLDMSTTTTNLSPHKMTYKVSDCPVISFVTAAVASEVRNYYVCDGIDASRLSGSILAQQKTMYSRSVMVTSSPTFEAPAPPANLSLLHDDLIVTVTVTYRKSNGVVREIKVADFLHAR